MIELQKDLGDIEQAQTDFGRKLQIEASEDQRRPGEDELQIDYPRLS